MERAALLASVRSFITWLQAYGDTSQDQYDFWANPAGRRAKRLAYRHGVAGLAVAAPFVLLDAALPGSRRLFRGRRRFAIADAHYAMGFFNLAAAGESGTGRAGGATVAVSGAAQPGTAGAAPPGHATAAPGGETGTGSRSDHLVSGRRYLSALSASRAPGLANAGWGYPFDWEGWFGTFKAGTPFITTTAYVYEAFEQGYELTGEAQYLEMMRSIARFAHEDLTDQEVAPGARASSYGPFDHRRVVNASAYRALLLTRAGQRFAREDWLETARGNLSFVLRSQQDDGSWLYAVDDRDRFVDNFHTCLVLKSLVKIHEANRRSAAIQETHGRGATIHETDGRAAILDAVRQGYAFYKRNLLDNRGLPVPFAQAQRLNLVHRELYDLAEGINLALLMRGLDPDADSIAGRLVTELLDHWALPDGHFVTRVTWFGRNTVPYHRWAQAQTFHALTRALLEEG